MKLSDDTTSQFNQKCRSLTLILFITLPQALLAMSRLATCQYMNNLAMLDCMQSKVLLTASKTKRRSFHQQCVNKTAGTYKHCIEYEVLNKDITADCATLFVPYSKTPKLSKTNTKASRCISDFLNELERCKTNLYLLKRSQRELVMKQCSAPVIVALTTCAKALKLKPRLLPPMERKLSPFAMPWRYKTPVKRGEKGMVCLIIQRPVTWYHATVIKQKKELIKLKGPNLVKGGYWFHQSQYAPLKGVTVTSPSKNEKKAHALQSQIVSAIKQNDALMLYIEEKMKKGNRFDLIVKDNLLNRFPQRTNDFLERISLKHNGVLFHFYSKKLNKRFNLTIIPVVTIDDKVPHWQCTVTGDIARAYLPEICRQ